jgi:PPOX class probable F420-dependent enzyme
MRGEDKINAFLAERRNAIVVGTRADGRPHATPNWFDWDGAHFYVSTTKDRVKYRLFARDPRAEFLIDDSTGFRYVLTDGTVEVREDLAAELPHFRGIRVKYGRDVPASDDELLASLQAEHRVMLVYTPDRPIAEWTARGFD